jgi:hypothetical protein
MDNDEELPAMTEYSMYLNYPIFNPMRLPFVLHTMINPNYNGILSVISNYTIGINSVVYNENESAKFYNIISTSSNKESDFLIGDQKVKVYTDFIKQKPYAVELYFSKELKELSKNSTVAVMTVCLILKYKSTNTQHVVFYRYIDI